MKKLFFLLIFFAFLIFPTRVLAATVSVSGPPASIGSDPFNVTVNISGASAGTNYLRVDLYKDGSTNYFGETHSGSDWYNGSDGTKYFPITIISGTDWSGSVQARVGSPSQSEYDGQGSYKLRVRRYTSSGSQGEEDANDSSIPVTINFPTITPTPTNTPTPTSSPTATNAPTSSKTPTPAPTSAPTSTPTKAPTPTVARTATLNSNVANIPTVTPTPADDNSGLGIAGNDNTDSLKGIGKDNVSPTSAQGTVLGISTGPLPWLLIALGLIFMVVCGILAYFQFGNKIFSLLKRKKADISL